MTTSSAAERVSLFRTSAVLGAAAVVSRASTVGVVSALAHGSGRSAVGLYGVATLTASFAALAGSCGLPGYLTRARAAGRATAEEVAAVHVVRLAVVTAASACIFAVAWNILPPSIALGFGGFAAAALLDQWNETAWVLIRGTRRAHLEAVVNGATSALLLVLVWALFAAGSSSFGLVGLLAAATAGARSVLACAVVRLPAMPSLDEMRASIRRNARPALPYMASDLLGLAYLRGDTLVLAAIVSTAQVGDYVAAASLVSPLVQVGASMGMGALASASRAADHGGAGELDVAKFFSWSGLLIAGLLCAGLDPVSRLLYGAAHEPISALAVILALFLPLRFLNFGLSALVLTHDRATRRLQIVILGAVINIVLNAALDPWAHAHGAAWATVLTEVGVAAAFLWTLGRRTLWREGALVASAVVLAISGPLVLLAHVPVVVGGLVSAAVLGAAFLVSLGRRSPAAPAPVMS